MNTTLRRTTAAIGAIGAIAATTLALAAPAAHAAPAARVEVRPAALDRGADPAVPFVRNGSVVDGARRVAVPGRQASVLGRSGDGYVVTSLVGRTWATSYVGSGSAVRIAAGPYPEQVTLGDDGGTVAVTTFLRKRTRIDVLVPSTGDRVRRGYFARFPRVLDQQGSRLVVGGPDGGYLWNVRTNQRRLVDSGGVYAADISANRLASFDKDPYEGGCSQVSTLVSPRELLWASCVEAVREFSPDGERIITQHKLTDGRGATRLVERTVEGRRLATYTVSEFFGGVQWESDDTVLLDAYGPKRWAVVRCTAGDCERASALKPTPY